MKHNNMNNIVTLAITAGLISTADAALVHAGGNVSLVSASTIESPAGIGAISDGITTDAPNGQVYTNARNGGAGDYFSVGDNLTVDINLGSAFSLDSIALFNRDANPNRNAVRQFSAEFSIDATFGDVGDTATGTFTALNSGPGQQDFAIGSTVSAQYVRITITDNYFGLGGGAGGDRVGFNDFQFNAVPEPSSTALLGLGGLALILRRRK